MAGEITFARRVVILVPWDLLLRSVIQMNVWLCFGAMFPS
jgi:hypothetical protein